MDDVVRPIFTSLTLLCVAAGLLLGGCASDPAPVRESPDPAASPGAGQASGPGEKLDDDQLPNADRAFDLVVAAKDKREAGEHAEAMQLLDEAIDADPGLAVAHLEWAVAAQYLGVEPEDIQNHLDRAITLSPDSARARQVRATYLLERGDHNGATADAERALVLRPELPGTRLLLARIAQQRDKPTAARDHYRVLLERQPQHIAALIGVATTSEKLGELDPAREALLKVAELQPDHIGHRRRLIAFFTRTGDEAAAKAQRKALDQIDPKKVRKLRQLRPSKRRRGKRSKKKRK